ncbi:hypothetical protein HDU76_013412 [Blyttiomyces sp. JEL0837]|nr:hypothetical protein HDU76_013412 [Blyttiomyces sp. JEL0837]
MILTIISIVLLGAGIDVCWTLLNTPAYTTWISHQTETDGYLDMMRMFTIAFYVFLGSLSLLLYLSSYLPHSFSFLKHKVLGLNSIYKTTPDRAMGMNCAVQMGLTMFPVSRNNIVSKVLNLNFDDALSFHRSSGAFAILLGLFHFVLYMISSFQAGGFNEVNKHNFLTRVFMDGVPPGKRSYPLYMSIIGIMSLFLFLWVAINSWSYIRRRWYMWFYFNHFVVIAAIGLGCLHASPVFYCAAPGILLYTIDGVARLFQTGRKHNIKTIAREANGYLRLEISDFPRTFYPGQWITVCIPAISRTQFHPFTIVNSHRLAHHPVSINNAWQSSTDPHDLVLIVKPSPKNGAWTKNLVEFVVNLESANNGGMGMMLAPELQGIEGGDKNVTIKNNMIVSEPTGISVEVNLPCFIHGPFGTLPTNFFKSKYILIMAGGSGITAGIAIAQAALRHPSKPLIKFIWSTNETKSDEMTDWMDLVSMEGANDRLEARIHGTSGDGQGRLDIGGVLKEWKRELFGAGGSDVVSVFACGPQGFTHEVAAHAKIFRKRVVHIEGFRR